MTDAGQHKRRDEKYRGRYEDDLVEAISLVRHIGFKRDTYSRAVDISDGA